MKNVTAPLKVVLLVSVIALIPGCGDWKNKLGLNKEAGQAADGQVLATVNGAPFMGTEEFEKQYNSFISQHPLGAMIAQMEGVKRKIFDGLVAQKLVTKYVEDNKIDQTPEYKEQLEQLKQMLNVRFFEQRNAAKVSDADLRKFYEENKDQMPELIVSRGGMIAKGVQFAKESDAKAFLDKVKAKASEIEKHAKESGFVDKFRDFKAVHAQSLGIDAGLRDKISAFKKVPGVELIKANDNSVWVVYVSGKEEPKHRSFEEAKQALEQRVTGQKQQEANAQAIEKLKSDYKLDVVNEKYFETPAPDAGQQEVLEEQLEAVMPAAAQAA